MKTETGDRPLSAKEIMQRLPHRHPFLMIDRVLRHGGGEAVAIKNVSAGEPHFCGHFPAEPIMPGVLIGESMAQTAAFVGAPDSAEPAAGGIGEKAFLTGMNLKIERPVVPGDQLVITARLVKRLGKLMKISARATVDQVVVASAEITVALV
jgi:3-hydroxyacyl-[acyl-carrier-protein] dehydratase